MEERAGGPDSTEIAGQVVSAMRELLIGLDAARPSLVRGLAQECPGHLHEGLLVVLMRLVFIRHAEDRELLRPVGRHFLRGLRERLVEEVARDPGAAEERRGAWERVLALFRLIHARHASGSVGGRGGGLFDPDESPFLIPVSDGCILRVLERLSHRTRDVEHLGSVYETLMGFGVAPGRSLEEPPVLQQSGERRRSGSHYTPRGLTAPVVEHALAPAFERLGPDATPAQVLALKVCDPAMGAGAFLVAACRQLAARLVEAWGRWPDARPDLPAGEDEALHARLLVARRCLYGVDRNPRAVDLARLSLWLATRAREHDFAFLDHALKCGDSLVGLTEEQISSTHWDATASPALAGGGGQSVESRSDAARSIANGVVAAFFSGDTPRERIERLVAFRSSTQETAASFADELVSGDILPFHWPIEFPEVFARVNPGFDAIVGNPPFAGKNTIINGNRKNYLPWLQTVHGGAHGNADLVAHFFRRSFDLLREGGVFGLIATNTIGQGDTRASGLGWILANGGAVLSARRRLKWPGEAAVTVSVAHVRKGRVSAPMLDGRPVSRISAYLVEGDLDGSPKSLAANGGRAFVGSYVLGMGFTFDDKAALKGKAEGLTAMRALIARDPRNAERIFPYIGGAEMNRSPSHAHHRHVIDFAAFPLHREREGKEWRALTEKERREALRDAAVPRDYPGPVAADWPDLLDVVRRRVKPARLALKDEGVSGVRKKFWWRYGSRSTGLYRAIAPLDRVLVTPRLSHFLFIVRVSTRQIFSDQLVLLAFSTFAPFAVLQSRVHELWARVFSSTLEDRLRYAPSDCFRTFPFPERFESDAILEAAGEACHAFRARVMIHRDEGLTRTCNRFHDSAQGASDIARLRELHAEMDAAVLRAYGWDDLAGRARPVFIEQEADANGKARTRLDWPPGFKDEVLARLLALNAGRAAAERAAGPTAADEEEDQEIEGQAAAG